MRHFIFILAVCALASIVGYGAWLINSSSHASAQGSLSTRRASQVEETLLQAAIPKSFRCPVFHGVPLQPSAKTGHHRVILTWNPSVFSTDPRREAAGYCLYRSGVQNVTKKDPKCSTCEQINQNSIPGTACVDDMVEDGETYYYIATAINSYGTSSFSDDTLAKIPLTPNSNSSVVPSYPHCRKDNQP